MSASTTDLTPSLLYVVKQVELAVRSRLDDALRPHGITTTQYTALTILEHRDCLSSAELARNAFVRRQSMADLLSALTRQRLVSRTQDPDDGRRMAISLTAEGRRVLDACRADVAELEARMVSSLSGAEVDALRSALNSCRESLH